LALDWERHSCLLAKNPPTADKDPADRARDLASKAARAAGHTAYRVGLRPQAMAVWLTMKPDILEYERSRGRRITPNPPPGVAPTSEEFDELPIAEKIQILRSPNLLPGCWSKLGPTTTSRRHRTS
jgi:hypothetical protein